MFVTVKMNYDEEYEIRLQLLKDLLNATAYRHSLMGRKRKFPKKRG